MSEKSKRTFTDLAKFDAHVIKPEEYEDAPELTAEEAARADVYIGGKLISRGRPPLANPKQAVKLRLDADVIERLKRKGPGWQTRLNATLRKALKLKAPQSKRARSGLMRSPLRDGLIR